MKFYSKVDAERNTQIWNSLNFTISTNAAVTSENNYNRYMPMTVQHMTDLTK